MVPLQLEHVFLAVVVLNLEQVAVVCHQLEVRLVDNLHCGLARKFKIIGVACSAVEVGSHVVAVILSFGGQTGH